MPTISAGNSASFTLDNDDVLTASGKGMITFTPAGQSAFTSYLDGLTTFPAFKKYTGVSIVAVKDVVYSTASDARAATTAAYALDSSGNPSGLIGPGGTDFMVISSSAPSDLDGRPNGTIYIQTAA